MAKPNKVRERSPYLDRLAKVRGEIRALSAGIESHLNCHAAWWKFTERAADARRLADLFIQCAELQSLHNGWESREEATVAPGASKRGHWMVLRNGFEPVDYGTSYTEGMERMRVAADAAEKVLRTRYPTLTHWRAENRDSIYVDCLTEGGAIMQREYFQLQNIAKD